jgi:hypothetical protein
MSSADIELRYPAASGSAIGNLSFRFENLTGSPIASATHLDNGQGIGGSYTLTFNVNGGVTVDVVAQDGSKNPNHATGLSVTADDVTVNYGIILGVGIVVASTVADGNQSRVSLGAYMDGGGSVTRMLNSGIVESGVEDPSEIEIAAVNIGSRDGAECVAIALPGFYFTPAGARTFILQIDNHTSPSREKLANSGTYTITYQNWDGPSKTADVYVNGGLAIASAIFDGTTRYQYGAGNGYVDGNDRLRGLSIVFQNQSSDPTSETHTLIVDGDSFEWNELAQDGGGAPGETWTTDGITLTESGEGTGIITSSGEVPFWSRWSPPDSASLGNLRLRNLRVRGESI